MTYPCKRVKGPQNQIQASSGKTRSWPLGQLKFEAIQAI